MGMFSEEGKSWTHQTFRYLQEMIHDWAVGKGWRQRNSPEQERENPTRNFGEEMANFHAELSEAWEEYRKYGLDEERFIYYSDPSPESTHENFTIKELASYAKEEGKTLLEYMESDGPLKPEGIAVELADTLIRIFDTCAAYDIPLAEALIIKMEYNETRSHRHGGKKA